MRKLALDLGSRSCGFAISDPMCIIASGLENLKFEEKDFEAVLQRISFYLKQYSDVDLIILGYPLRSNGDKSQTTLMVEEFKQMLEKYLLANNYQIPIKLINEYGSTIKAESVLIESGMTRQKRKTLKDKLAAVIILQEYLKYYI
ncbi:Holliday junction resolvase RuvX [Mycoplasmopsis ciconiae]|uniref:Putative pre-16S rRNA nuclease n=1 Tax=Mycoplasmopsis ciconiae TaxID=561067 RepID=A0ABU7MMF5_9BACT|nr:Holliday junction resolvase RuvX [Mycoplasmopsis ciconiae]